MMGAREDAASYGPSINNNWAPVHAELCKASADLAAIYRRNLRTDLADSNSDHFLELGCPVEPSN